MRKGNVVVYPRWQTSIATPCPGPFNIEPCIDAAVNGIRGALAYLRASGSRVQPDLTRASYFGHSFGGIVTSNFLNRHKQLGLPEPKAVFLDDPHDGGFTGDNEPALDDDLSGIPPTTLFQCYSGAHGVIDDPSNVRPPNPKPNASCNSLFPKLVTIPAANKDLVLLNEDAHGSPALTSDHGTCNSVRPPDAYDWNFCWRIWDALRDAAYKHTDCEFALGDTAEHRSNGRWSDGVPVAPLKIQEAAPIRAGADPSPPRDSSKGCAGAADKGELRVRIRASEPGDRRAPGALPGPVSCPRRGAPDLCRTGLRQA